MRIAISPDENPGDSGSVAADGTTERSVNLRVAYALRSALVRCGQDAWFDPNITYVERVSRANTDGTGLLVACAHDVSTPGVSGGTFVFCSGGLTYGRQSAAADAVYGELAKIAGWPARRGNTIEDVYECCAFSGDTVYAEYLCMSPDDEPLWSRSDYGVLAAEATARGLASVYGFPYIPPIGGSIFMALTDDQQATLLQAVLDIHGVAAKLDARVFGDIADSDVGLGNLVSVAHDIQSVVHDVKVIIASMPIGGGLTSDQASQLMSCADALARIEAALKGA